MADRKPLPRLQEVAQSCGLHEATAGDPIAGCPSKGGGGLGSRSKTPHACRPVRRRGEDMARWISRSALLGEDASVRIGSGPCSHAGRNISGYDHIGL